MTLHASAPGLSEGTPSAAHRWRRVPLRWRVALIVLGALIVAELAASFVSGIGGQPSGASGPSSTLDTSASGAGAFAALLGARGYRVQRLTQPLSAVTLRSSTVFVLDPTSWSASSTAALRRDLDEGDRMVLGGRPPKGVLRALLGSGPLPRWSSGVAGVTRPSRELSEVHGVGAVDSRGQGTFESSRGASPRTTRTIALLSGRAGALAFITGRQGALVLLASSSPLQDGSLARADNAAFGVDLAGRLGSVVAFDEYDHGFGHPGDGLAGLPAPWRFGLAFTLVAVVVWMLSASRRFGPPDEPDRIVVPARVQFVEAMATLLSARPKEQWTEAVEPLRTEARRALCRRLGVAPDTGDEALVDALARDPRTGSLSPPHDGVEAVLHAGSGVDDVLALGRAFAWLEREDARR